MNIYQQLQKMTEINKLFEEYRNMARLVDDLDIRFWKRFVTRDSRRVQSIDEAIAEKEIRREYQQCVTDMIVLRGRVNDAIMSVKNATCRDLLTEYYIHDLDYDEIAVKWKLKKCQVSSLIQKGLLEAVLSNKE